MKPKLTKRSISNKHSTTRVFPTQTRQSSTPPSQNRITSPNRAPSDTLTVQSDSSATCLKPNEPLKSQKLLKRDLLRCSNQRPSLLGLQTLQPPRIHHGSQTIPPVVALTNRQTTQRQSSLPDNPHTLRTTIDRIGPWPDISINCLALDSSDFLQPIKNFRNTKNSRLFSPKYYAALTDHTNKFKFHSSKRSYIDEYRKQKGYVISSHPKPLGKTLSLSSLGQIPNFEDDPLSIFGTFTSGTGNCTARDRTDVSLSTGGMAKSLNDITDNHNRSPSNSYFPTQLNNLPSIPTRSNNQLRVPRPNIHQQTITLPTITHSTFQYLHTLNPNETNFDEHKKFPSSQNQSKVYFIDGRQQKSDTEVTSCSQDYAEFRTSGSSVIPNTDRSAAVVIYQLARRT